MITVMKTVYLYSDIQRYYVSINGGLMREINLDAYSRYLKQCFHKSSYSEQYQDRTVIFHDLQAV